jgi:uncharacterized protein YciI
VGIILDAFGVKGVESVKAAEKHLAVAVFVIRAADEYAALQAVAYVIVD